MALIWLNVQFVVCRRQSATRASWLDGHANIGSEWVQAISSVTLLIAHSSKQIAILLFNSRELTVDSAQRHSGNRKVPAEIFKLFPNLRLFEELCTVPRVHLVDCVLQIGIVEIRKLGFRYEALSGLRKSFAGKGAGNLGQAWRTGRWGNSG